MDGAADDGNEYMDRHSQNMKNAHTRVDERFRHPFVPPETTIHSPPQGKGSGRFGENIHIVTCRAEPLRLIQSVQGLQQGVLRLRFQDEFVLVLQRPRDICAPCDFSKYHLKSS